MCLDGILFHIRFKLGLRYVAPYPVPQCGGDSLGDWKPNRNGANLEPCDDLVAVLRGALQRIFDRTFHGQTVITPRLVLPNQPWKVTS